VFVVAEELVDVDDIDREDLSSPHVAMNRLLDATARELTRVGVMCEGVDRLVVAAGEQVLVIGKRERPGDVRMTLHFVAMDVLAIIGDAVR